MDEIDTEVFGDSNFLDIEKVLVLNKYYSDRLLNIACNGLFFISY